MSTTASPSKLLHLLLSVFVSSFCFPFLGHVCGEPLLMTRPMMAPCPRSMQMKLCHLQNARVMTKTWRSVKLAMQVG